MKLDNIHSIYFLGIGGIGMSALARYFNQQGKKVAGYDKTPTMLTDQLISEGIHCNFVENINNIPQDIDLCVYTPAVPSDNIELAAIKAKNIPLLKRSEILGLIANDYFTIAIAGTHGKTTLTSMITHILITAGYKVNAFIGGIANNYESNLIISENAKILVVEADEYDRSFLTLSPNIAVITSIDPDHLDIYNNIDSLKTSFLDFINKIKDNGLLVLKKGLLNLIPKRINIKEYCLDGQSEVYARAITINTKHTRFTYCANQFYYDFELGIFGKHNVENALAAITVAKHLDIEDSNIAKALSSFKGVKRRFDIRINRSDLVLIDDYAHHPAEIEATLATTKSLFKNKKITAVFQPHLYSRTRDLADEFAKSLQIADEILLLEIYPAREMPIKGIDSQFLLNKIDKPNKIVLPKDKLISYLKNQKPEVVVMMGAGDIDLLVEPLEKALTV